MWKLSKIFGYSPRNEQDFINKSGKAALYLLATILSGCHPQVSIDKKSDSLPHVNVNSSSRAKVIDATKYQFQLFRYTPRGGWHPVPKLKNSQSRITIFLHGFSIGKRTEKFEIHSEEISKRLGMVNLADPNLPLREPPRETTAYTDVYALAWNSVAGNPWELEQLMGGKVDLRKFVANPKDYDCLFGHDPFDQAINEPLFKQLESYYKIITEDLKDNQLNFAGFSKGGHMALKLAQIHVKFNKGTRKLRNLYLLDPYVGPPVLNGGLGQELIQIVHGLKSQVNIINIETSNVSKVGDPNFYHQLRKEVGQISIQRNRIDHEKAKSVAHLSKFKPFGELYLDHFRAPQYLLGSALVCDSRLPTIEHPGRARNLKVENPNSISEWIYNGEFKPIQCPRLVDLE